MDVKQVAQEQQLRLVPSQAHDTPLELGEPALEVPNPFGEPPCSVAKVILLLPAVDGVLRHNARHLGHPIASPVHYRLMVLVEVTIVGRNVLSQQYLPSQCVQR